MAQRGDWPENPVIYQVYPRSFQDSNGSGEGDLAGAAQRLDHIARLGADAVWLSPFFISPMCDGGYDVADMSAVDPRFGTLDDFDALVARAHELGLKVMIDQVFNHTSVDHPWFERSLARDPDFADFYVWADPMPDGGPPSNWIGYFGHPAWKWHPRRGQYCLHKFLPCQPGLNHYNPAVHARLAEITRFWRDRGVDGFRYDAITSLFYDPGFPDNPPAGDAQARIPGPSNNPFTMQRHDHDVVPGECAAFAARIRAWAGDDCYLLGEINKGLESVEILKDFSRPDRLDAGYVTDIAVRGLSGMVLADMIGRLGSPGPLMWWLSTHDEARQASRLGDGTPHDARMLAALLLALPGPVLIYQGEELGMAQPELPREMLRDPFDRAFWPDDTGRDGARTPIPWDWGPNHGFTEGAPWLPVFCPPEGPASAQWGEPNSVLHFYATALAKRRMLGLADAGIEVIVADDAVFAARLMPREGPPVTLCVNLARTRLPRPAGCGPVQLASVSQDDPDAIAPRSAIWCSDR